MSRRLSDEQSPRAVAERYWAAEMRRDTDAIIACFHDEATFETAERTWRGTAEIRTRYEDMARAYSAVRVVIGREIAESNRAAIEWAAELREPSGRLVHLKGVNLVQVRSGRFTEVVCYYDSGPGA